MTMMTLSQSNNEIDSETWLVDESGEYGLVAEPGMLQVPSGAELTEMDEIQFSYRPCTKAINRAEEDGPSKPPVSFVRVPRDLWRQFLRLKGAAQTEGR
jgi:hypothetical protein